MTTYTSKLYYLATPYAKFPGGREAAYQIAVANTALLTAHHIPVYSPIIHGHPQARLDPVTIPPTDNNFWTAVNLPFLERCDALIVVNTPGWERSIGINIEAKEFWNRGKPAICMQPGQIPECFRGDPATWP